MKVRIQLVIETENGEPAKVEEIARLERGALRPQDLGLTLAEAKVLLHGMQQAVVTEQIAEYLEKFSYVVCKRFVKKQQMRWTQRGAHLLGGGEEPTAD